MKTSVVETARVLETKGDMATVMVEQGTSCKGCGMAKLGMCRPGGAGMVLQVKNTLGARVGDRVMIGLDSRVHMRGYLIAFILPLLGMFIGATAGYIVSASTGIKGLDVVTGFVALGVTLYFSLRKLRSMDKEERMHIKRILY